MTCGRMEWEHAPSRTNPANAREIERNADFTAALRALITWDCFCHPVQEETCAQHSEKYFRLCRLYLYSLLCSWTRLGLSSCPETYGHL